jgi:flagellar motor switch protein FliN/FliY
MSLTAEPSIDATPAVELLAREITAALAGADGSGLTPGPAADQDNLAETIPDGGGVAAAVEVTGIGVVAIMLSADQAAQLDSAHGQWTNPVNDAIRSWARAHAATVESLTPPCPAGSIGELLPRSEELRIIAAGLFDDDRHAGTVVLTVNPNAPAPTRTTTTPAPTEAPSAAPAEAAPAAAPTGSGEAGPLQALASVEMAVTAELGRTTMAVSDLLGLAPGSLIELDRAAGSPIDVLVNGTLIARGEVVVIDDDFGLRITEIIGPDEAAS